VINLCGKAVQAYVQDEDYATAVRLLKQITVLLEQVPNYDRLVMDYLRGITHKYDTLLKSYEDAIDEEIEDKAQFIYSGQYLKTYYASKNGASVYEKLRSIGRKSTVLTQKKTLWLNLIRQNKEEMTFTLYSGKK
jgi:hypothetical protein